MLEPLLKDLASLEEEGLYIPSLGRLVKGTSLFCCCRQLGRPFHWWIHTGGSHCYGVKQLCPLAEKLEHFDVISGYPPDLLHYLFEGIVPKK